MRKGGGHCRGIAKNSQFKCIGLQSGNSQNKMSESSSITQDVVSRLQENLRLAAECRGEGGRKVFKVKAKPSLEGERPSKLRQNQVQREKGLQSSRKLCRTGPCSALLSEGCWEMASECPQAEQQARSFANNTRTGLTGLRVRRPRGTDRGGGGRWCSAGWPRPVGVCLPEPTLFLL